MLGVARIHFDRRTREGILGDPDLTGVSIRRLFAWLDELGHDDGPPGTYRPPIDVVETADAVEIVADLPGVDPDAIRVAYSDGVIVVAGRKRASACQHEAAFHLAERTFGRFATGIRVTAAVDLARSRARLQNGELHITLPRIAERRRREIPITVERS
jgi:HSP20 family protein